MAERRNSPTPRARILSGLAPFPCLATMLAGAAFAQANLGGSNLSTPYDDYGFPLMYRRHHFRPLGVDQFHPAALGFDVGLAATAVAATFFATRRWSSRIGRFHRFTVSGLMATVALCGVAFAVSIAAPLFALIVLLASLLYGLCCIVHVLVLVTFRRRTEPRDVEGDRA